MSNTRRQFMTHASLGAATAAAAAPPQSAAPERELRIGCLNVHNYSHLLPLWAPLMNPRADQKEVKFTGMRITHCWEIELEKSAEFAKMYGCEAVRNFDDMLGKVDGIISGGYFHYPWNHIIHEPYLEAGLPNLINRPFASSLAKARQMIDTAKKHGATILCPSAYEYCNSTAQAQAWVKGKKVLCYGANNWFDEYPTHGVHGLYMIYRAIVAAGNPIVSVQYRAKNWYTPPGVMTLEHHDAEGREFFGTLHQSTSSGVTLQVHTKEASDGKPFAVASGVGFPFNKTEVWAPTIWAYERMARYKEMPETFDAIMDKTRIFLAGWHSVANSGKVVRLEDVPEDLDTPAALPARPNDRTAALFKQKFG